MSKLIDPVQQSDCLTYVKHWLNAIALHAPEAPLVFVGTLKDRLPSKTQHHEPISALIAAHFRDFLQHAVFNERESIWFFPVDNTLSGTNQHDPTIEFLRSEIERTVRKQDYVKLEIPVSWLAFFDHLRFEFNGRGCTPPKRLSLEQITVTAAEFGIKSENDRNQMLRVLHEFGLLLHYPDPLLRSIVVLDPQWLLDSFSAIIRDIDLHFKPEDRPLLQFSSELSFLKERASLDTKLLPVLWKDHNEEERRACLHLMCKYHLAVPIRDLSWTSTSQGTDHNAMSNMYLMPSLLPFDLTGRTFSDEFRDSLSGKFQAQLPRYTAENLEEGQSVFYVHFHVNEKRWGSTATVSTLEKNAVLPWGLFSRLLCKLTQEHQYTSVQTQSLSRTAASMTLSNVVTDFTMVPHIGGIRVKTSSELALQTARRIEDWIKAICVALFPALQVDLFLPYDSENLI